MPCLSQVQHRLLELELASKFECQSPLLRRMALLPSEVIEHIIVFVLLQEQCALRFFAGGIFCADAAEGGLTPLQARLCALYDLRRVDVFTRDAGHGRGGGTHVASAAAPHMPVYFRSVSNNQIVRWSPGVRDLRMYFPQHFAQASRLARLTMTSLFDENRARSMSMNDSYWAVTADGHPALPERPLYLDPLAVRDLPFTPGLFAPLKTLTPPLPGRAADMRSLMLGNRAGRRDPLNIRFMDFGARGSVPGTATTRKERFRQRVLREQAAWLDLDWAAMHRLRQLFIDLSWVTRTGEDDVVRDGAARMSEHLNLELLVVYGLRSSKERWFGLDSREERELGRYYAGRGRAAIAEGAWEGEGDEVLSVAGEEHVNWARVFGGAVAGGGRLVLLDDRLEDVDWAALEAQAMAEGKLEGGITQ